METLVHGRNLKKRYGTREVVRGVAIEVRAGEVLAVIGPNGAGKTTTLELLLGVRDRDDGEVRWWHADARRKVGVQLQTTPFFPGLTATENLRVVASLYGVRLDDEAARALLARCGLADVARADAARLSGGQQKRLSLAMALAHEPRLVVLDEPAAALDPRGQAEVRALVRALAESGTAVVLTSHDMNEVAAVADRIALIDAGEVKAEGSPAELLARFGVTRLDDLYLKLTAGAAA